MMISRIAGSSALVLMAVGLAICATPNSNSSTALHGNTTAATIHVAARHYLFPTYANIKRENVSDAGDVGDDVADKDDDTSSSEEGGDP
ncbi:hypothetical protein PG995_007763 [Apiospora arundinis]